MDGQPQFDISKLSASDRNELNQFLQNETQKSNIQQSTSLYQSISHLITIFLPRLVDENLQMTSINLQSILKYNTLLYQWSKLIYNVQPSTTSPKSASRNASPPESHKTNSPQPRSRALKTVSTDGWMRILLLSSIWRIYANKWLTVNDWEDIQVWRQNGGWEHRT